MVMVMIRIRIWKTPKGRSPPPNAHIYFFSESHLHVKLLFFEYSTHTYPEFGHNRVNTYTNLEKYGIILLIFSS